MASKAEEWAEHQKERPVYKGDDSTLFAQVQDNGSLWIKGVGEFRPGNARSFARWLLETFDEPAQERREAECQVCGGMAGHSGDCPHNLLWHERQESGGEKGAWFSYEFLEKALIEALQESKYSPVEKRELHARIDFRKSLGLDQGGEGHDG